VVIGNAVTNINATAFSGCTGLVSVYFRGNAPSASPTLFATTGNPTSYYLPGTTGWSTTFGGRLTSIWNPKIETSHASFGVRTNRFGFTITGAANIPIVVEANSNLVGGVWTPLQTCTLTNGSIYFGDSNWTNYPVRVYRIRSP
jgi:hypothetical protein